MFGFSASSDSQNRVAGKIVVSLFLAMTASVCLGASARAQSAQTSDIIGIRVWNPTTGPGGIFHDSQGRPVVDSVIPEPASELTPEPPATVMSVDAQGNSFDVELNVAHGLPNNSDVFLNTTGTVYLLEPGSQTQVSDIITLSFTPDPNAFFLIFVNLTLQSDPGNFSIPSGTSPSAILTETGSFQDITLAIFDTVAPGAAHPVSNSPGTYPFAVLVQSDLDPAVPELPTYALLMIAFAVVAGLRALPAFRTPLGFP